MDKAAVPIGTLATSATTRDAHKISLIIFDVEIFGWELKTWERVSRNKKEKCPDPVTLSF